MISYQVTTAVLGLAIAAVLLWLLRRDRLHARHALWWSAVALAVVVLGLFPRLVDWVAGWLGVAYPPVLALVMAVGVILVKMLLMDLEHSRQERTLRRLAQRIAILEAELKRNTENHRSQKP